MSHELRTPFRFIYRNILLSENLFILSSFYGLLDILSGTELNNGQREIGGSSNLYLALQLKYVIVQTAKQSCELLLKVFYIMITMRTH
jgi:hypothetical protein